MRSHFSSIAGTLNRAWKSFLAHGSRAAANIYIWTGLGALLAIALVVYFLIDNIIMPSYTRHEVTISVPAVLELPVDEAREIVLSRNLRVETDSQQYNPAVPRDYIVDQDPPPNTAVKPGRRIYLTINSGEVPTVEVPNLRDVSLRQARSQLASRGLQIGEIEIDSMPSPFQNTVTRQSPEPGDTIPTGSEIDLWVSPGLGDQEVLVPDLIGKSLQEGDISLRRERLRMIVPHDTDDLQIESFEIVRQDPAPFTSVPEGTEVRVYVQERNEPLDRDYFPNRPDDLDPPDRDVLDS